MNPSSQRLTGGTTYVDFPLRIDATGLTRTTTQAEHVRNLIEQLLFTSPRERVNRPASGSGIEQAVFQPNVEILASTSRITAEAAIQQHLGHLIDLNALNIETDDSTLKVEVTYTLRKEKSLHTSVIQRTF